MKELLLVRHAKSSWEDFTVSDRDRPLNDRGKRDAPAMAERLHNMKVKMQHIVSSPAKRAKKTAEIFAKEFGKKIILEEELYEPGRQSFLNVISDLPHKVDCVAIFSHNPGITEFANSLTEARIDNIPTCGVFGVKAECEDWKDFAEAQKNFWFFEYPKKGQD